MKILLTGSQGRMGPHLLPILRERHHVLTFDKAAPRGDNLAFRGDLSSLAKLQGAMRGCEVVVHLAATSDEAPFVEQLVPNNVVGAWNVFEAARLEGVRRIVFASTIQTVGRYGGRHGREHDERVETHEPPRPNTLYGATKILGETMGRWFHDAHGLEFIAIRIGGFQPYDSPLLAAGKMLHIWLSPRDAGRIFTLAVEKSEVKWAVVNATSRTTREFLSLRSAREILGYEPQDDVRQFLPPAL